MGWDIISLLNTGQISDFKASTKITMLSFVHQEDYMTITNYHERGQDGS